MASGVPLSLQDALTWYDKAAARGNGQVAYFAKYIRDNHGLDGTQRDDEEQAIMGPMVKRMFPRQPPAGVVFHSKAERLAYVRSVAADNGVPASKWITTCSSESMMIAGAQDVTTAIFRLRRRHTDLNVLESKKSSSQFQISGRPAGRDRNTSLSFDVTDCCLALTVKKAACYSARRPTIC
jgi:hypothetical protein